jgi:hypothetical protein
LCRTSRAPGRVTVRASTVASPPAAARGALVSLAEIQISVQRRYDLEDTCSPHLLYGTHRAHGRRRDDLSALDTGLPSTSRSPSVAANSNVARPVRPAVAPGAQVPTPWRSRQCAAPQTTRTAKSHAAPHARQYTSRVAHVADPGARSRPSSDACHRWDSKMRRVREPPMHLRSGTSLAARPSCATDGNIAHSRTCSRAQSALAAQEERTWPPNIAREVRCTSRAPWRASVSSRRIRNCRTVGGHNARRALRRWVASSAARTKRPARAATGRHATGRRRAAGRRAAGKRKRPARATTGRPAADRRRIRARRWARAAAARLVAAPVVAPSMVAPPRPAGGLR